MGPHAPAPAAGGGPPRAKEARVDVGPPPGAEPPAPAPAPPTPVPWVQLISLAAVLFCQAVQIMMLFPILVFMVQWYGVAERSQDVGRYAGVLASMFPLGMFLTTFGWGWVSDRAGRKPVLLIGAIGSAVFTLAFGNIRHYGAACATRFGAGMINNVAATLKCMVAEMTDDSNQARSMSLFSLAWMVGTIFGPSFSGFLAQPCDSFLRCGEGHLFRRLPFLLPFLATAAITLGAIVQGAYLLPETLKEKRPLGLGRALGRLARPLEGVEAAAGLGPYERLRRLSSLRWSLRRGGLPGQPARLRRAYSVRAFPLAFGSLRGAGGPAAGEAGRGGGYAPVEQSVELVAEPAGSDAWAAGGGGPHEGGAGGGRKGEAAGEAGKAPSVRFAEGPGAAEEGGGGRSSAGGSEEGEELALLDDVETAPAVGFVWYRDRRVLLGTSSYVLCAFMFILADELFPIYGSTRVEEGGLSLTSNDIGLMLSVGGGLTIPYILFGYPPLAKRYGAVNISSCASLIFTALMLATPLLSLVVHNKPALWTCLCLYSMTKSTSGATIFTSTIMLTTNSSPSETMGLVNSAAQAFSSLGRAVGPAMGGLLWSFSLGLQQVKGHQGVPFVVVGAISFGQFLVTRACPQSMNRTRKD